MEIKTETVLVSVMLFNSRLTEVHFMMDQQRNQTCSANIVPFRKKSSCKNNSTLYFTFIFHLLKNVQIMASCSAKWF